MTSRNDLHSPCDMAKWKHTSKQAQRNGNLQTAYDKDVTVQTEIVADAVNFVVMLAGVSPFGIAQHFNGSIQVGVCEIPTARESRALKMNSVDADVGLYHMVQLWDSIPPYTKRPIKKLSVTTSNKRSSSITVHHPVYDNKMRVRAQTYHLRLDCPRDSCVDLRLCLNKITLLCVAALRSRRKPDDATNDLDVMPLQTLEI